MTYGYMSDTAVRELLAVKQGELEFISKQYEKQIVELRETIAHLEEQLAKK